MKDKNSDREGLIAREAEVLANYLKNKYKYHNE